MLSSHTVRQVRLAAPILAVLATLGLVAWIVRPAWQEHQAVQALLDAVEVYDPQAIEEQTEILRRMHRGGTVVGQLEQALRDKQGRVRKGAAMALGKLGPEAKSAVPSVLEAMHDPDASVRQMASEAIGYLGFDALVALVESLRSDDPELRELAADVLGSLGPDAVTLVPALLEAMTDDRVRLPAAHLHERPRPPGDAPDLVQDAPGDASVAVLVEVPHGSLSGPSSSPSWPSSASAR